MLGPTANCFSYTLGESRAKGEIAAMLDAFTGNDKECSLVELRLGVASTNILASSSE